MLNQRYKIEQLVGTGGFAKVYKAFDTKLNIHIALKRFAIDEVKAKFAGREDYVEKYSGLGEVRRAILLNHPNVLRYFDTFTYSEQGTFGEEAYEVIVMEYLPDGDFEAFAKRYPVGTPEFERAVRGVLAGLGYLHDNQMIHRDLKAANVLFSGTTPKITDFGISKSYAQEGSDVSSALIGTPETNAPERIAPEEFGINGKVGYNSDLWSFGVMLYRLCTGEYPFGSREAGNTDSGKIMNNIFREDYRIPKMDQIPQPFRKLIEACLVRQADKRLPSAAEGLKLLSQKEDLPAAFAAAGGETVFAERRSLEPAERRSLEHAERPAIPPSAHRTRKPKKKKVKVKAEGEKSGIPIWVWGALGSCVLVGLAWFLWPGSDPKDQLIPTLDEASGLYGYADAAGAFVIPARFEKVEPFAKGQAQVIVADSVYTIDKSGKLITLIRPTAEEIEERAWKEAEGQNTQEAYEAYLAQYPEGAFADKANAQIEELKKYTADNEAWKKAGQKDRKSAYHEYLDAFPEGLHAKEAKKRIDEIRAAEKKAAAEKKKKQDESDWAYAKRKHSISAYQNYLKKHPDGRYRSEARKRLQKLQSGTNAEGEVQSID